MFFDAVSCTPSSPEAWSSTVLLHGRLSFLLLFFPFISMFVLFSLVYETNCLGRHYLLAKLHFQMQTACVLSVPPPCGMSCTVMTTRFDVQEIGP